VAAITTITTIRSLTMPLRIAALLLACVAVFSAHAQPAWPAAKPITLIVPFAAGGNVDVTARVIGQKLAERLKQSVIIENVAGAGGTIGTERTVRAAPDGYTLLLGADSPIGITKLVNPAAVRYDSARDLAAVGLVTTAPMIIIARPDLPASTLAELIKLARDRPGQLSYGTSGIGSVLQLAMETINVESKVAMVHVPYRGGAQIATDVIGKQLDLAMVISVTATPHILGKKLKGIAVTSDKRLPGLPDVPAVAETPGFKGFDMVSWTGLFAPAQTPPAVVERLNRELMEVLRADDVRAKLADGGAAPGSGSAADFARFMQKEQARYAVVVKAANIRE
jgi:tripartite-type tricarboxylate transporter receptor subunit TctC